MWWVGSLVKFFVGFSMCIVGLICVWLIMLIVRLFLMVVFSVVVLGLLIIVC